MRPSKRASGGPQPLLEEDIALFEMMDRRERAMGGPGADMLELLEGEEQDDEARRLERLIAQAIRVHGDSLTDLCMSSPRCTESVCEFHAVGPGPMDPVMQDPNDPRGFLKMAMGIAAEPWFQKALTNAHYSTSLEDGQVVYRAMFLRR